MDYVTILRKGFFSSDGSFPSFCSDEFVHLQYYFNSHLKTKLAQSNISALIMLRKALK